MLPASPASSTASDPGPYTLYTGPINVPAGATLVYRSVDRNGNVSATWSLTAPAGTT